MLAGECVLVVEGEARQLKQWDLFHCPRGVDHAIVGAGDDPSLVLAVGARTGAEDEGLVYPADQVAQEHAAGVPVETSDPKVAYVPFSFRKCGYEDGWLPD